MQPENTAVCEPHLWTPGPPAYFHMNVDHPNGVSLSITPSVYFWNIRRRLSNDTPANDDNCLARIPRTGYAPDLTACITDTVAVTGPAVRAQMDRALLHVCAWGFSIDQEARVLTLFRDKFEVMINPGMMLRPLPPALLAILQSVPPVLLEDMPSGSLTLTSNVRLTRPTTAHQLLELHALALTGGYLES